MRKPAPARGPPAASWVRAERELVRMLLHQRRYIEAAAERVDPELFADSAYRAIFERLTAHDADAPIDELAPALDEEATEVLQELLNETGGLDPPRKWSTRASTHCRPTPHREHA